MVVRWSRITVDPKVMGGKPCIRGMRFPVSRILAMLAAGEDERTILAHHPDLEPEDIRQALEYAACQVDHPGAGEAVRGEEAADVRSAIEFPKRFRRDHPLRGLKIADMIREGRRY